MNNLEDTDKEVYSTIKNELERQEHGLEMIPSESFISRAVMQALGSPMNNKYSEGYPGKRYYGGNQYIDVAENLAIERAKKLFSAEHVNVQPYSGSPANVAVYFALADFGDTLMGMRLDMGGHLTHGSPVNFTGKAYHFVSYGVDKKTGLLDMDEIRAIAKKEKPKIIVSGATAYPRTIDFKHFHEICEEIDAYSMADVSHIAGLIAGSAHPSPFPFTDVVTTTTHKTLCGPRGAMIMSRQEDRLKEIHHKGSKWNLAQLIDRAVFPGLQGGPHNHTNSAKAVAFGQALRPEFSVFARQIVKNAKALAEELISLDVRLVSGGTDNHLILVDLQNKGIKGKEAESALDKARITVNKNMIPYDPSTPFDPSGIRFGTPALTQRGMKESEMKQIAALMAKVLDNHDKPDVLKDVSEQVYELSSQFPLYPGLKL
ncbi:serine hydroxymethyltransferase [Candidatus Woesearchaeota archaeon]|nr:serine hydroxymethyltransferase [Candidatus Woesearchaeota archaeon]